MAETICSSESETGGDKALKALLEKDIKSYKTIEMKTIIELEFPKAVFCNLMEKNLAWNLDKIAHYQEREHGVQALEFNTV